MSKKTDIRERIYKLWDKEPELLPKTIADKVRGELGPKLSRNNSYPSVRSVQQYVKEFKDRLGSAAGEEQEWSLLALRIYEIPPEALATVLEVWAYALKEWSKSLTIREAKWVSRLHKLFLQKDITRLFKCALQYAAYEKSLIVLGDKIVDIARAVVFERDTELYVDVLHPPELKGDEILRVYDDPEILKRKRQKLLDDLRGGKPK